MLLDDIKLSTLAVMRGMPLDIVARLEQEEAQELKAALSPLPPLPGGEDVPLGFFHGVVNLNYK